MRTIEELLFEIEDRLLTYEGDDILKSPPANIQVNAPLALMQVELDAKMRMLRYLKKFIEG